MRTNEGESLQVIEIVKMAGRIYEDAGNHVWYVPTPHPIFSALAMVAGPVSRQIEAGLLSTGIEGTRRYAEVSAAGESFLSERSADSDRGAVDGWLSELLADADDLDA